MAVSGPTFELGSSEGAQGSCRYVDGATVVLATASGPQHNPERASSQDAARGGLEVRVQLADRGGADRVLAERTLEEAARGLLAPALDCAAFPRQVASVYCLVLHDGGAARRCVVNACALAALDARLPLLAVPLGVDVVVAAAAADGGDAPRPTTCNVTMDATTDESAVLAMDTAGEPFDAADVAAVVAAARTEVTALAAAALAQQAAAS